MTNIKRRIIKISLCFNLFILAFLFPFSLVAQSNIRFEENKGQWDGRVLYMARLDNGFCFVQSDGLLFSYSSATHSHSELQHQHTDTTYSRHAFLMSPLNMANQIPESSELLQGYSNYYIGNDETKWRSNVSAYGTILYRNVYQGIDWKIYSFEGELKHEFILKPSSDVSQIRLLYSGVESMSLNNGDLHLVLAVGEVIEAKPYAYQWIDGRKVEVEVSFILEEDKVGYEVGNYDTNYELVIDPALIFSTYSGSSADNWGFTATYDSYGNLYSGSIVSGIGYPTTLGAFSDYFSGIWDCAITKFSADGTQMLFSTYFGGDYSEMPHSMIVNSYDELVVFGTTGSFNFPTTDGAYQRWFQQGTAVSYDGTVLFPHGVDIYVSSFTSDGTQLKSSTYVGGSANDGLNYRERYNMSSILTYVGNDSLYANYGDGARGELITDDRNNIYVGSSTFSDDFPTTASAFQTTLGGEQDGVVFKLDYTLGTLIFSSYFGGSGDDAVFSIDTDSEYRLYVTGGTVSDDFPTTQGAYSTTHNGGAVDAFLALVSYDGANLLHSTFFGSNAFDLSYFVRTDRWDNPHIFGQTKASGTTLVHNAQYNIPNSGQFITKFSPLLDTIIFSTVFGTGDNQINISPTGFSVDVCGRIYISGWGRMFKYLPNLPNVYGTRNMQLTSNAYQTQTDAQDFYIMSLSSDASSLDYATFFGEVSSTNNHGIDHVDGGTSRFDKFGNLYQVVCASCSGTQNFPIAPPNAWSPINASTNCNAAAFKFNIHSDFAVADFKLPNFVCYPDSVRLTNLSRGDNYLWLFGDGTYSTEENPVHYYSESGTYDITLISYMQDACLSSDTLTQRITLLDSQVDTLETKYVCSTEFVQIGVNTNAQNDVQFQWIPSEGLSNANVPNPYAQVEETTTYRLVVSTEECTDTLIQEVVLRNLTITLPDSLNYCNYPYQYSLPTMPEGYDVTVSWDREGLDSLEVLNGVIQIDTIVTDWLYIHIREGNCEGKDSVFMNYNGGLVQLNAVSTRCNNENNGYVLISTSNFTQPLFVSCSNGFNGADIDSLGGLSVGDYTLTITDFNGCTYSTEFSITSPDDLSSTYEKNDNPCQSSCTASIDLTLTGGVLPYQIQWSNGMNTEDISLLCSGEYIYTITDAKGCVLQDTINIIDLDSLVLNLSATDNNCPQGCSASITTQISGGTHPYTYQWSNGFETQNITQVCCGDYSLIVKDANNCQTQGEISVGYVDAFANFEVSASETRVYDGHQIQLTATSIPGMTYTWTPSDNLHTPFQPTTLATMYETTVFYVYVTDNSGCDIKDSVIVEVDVVNCGKPNIYVPNVFTPNNDGKNDKIFVKGDWIDRFTFEIFDRWGEKVFSTHSLEEGWDGTYNGMKCDAAVYYYKLEVDCLGGKTYITGGDITLIR